MAKYGAVCFKKNPETLTIPRFPGILAEGGGFEPPVRFPAHMFSKHAVSATHPPLLKVDAKSVVPIKAGANVNNYLSKFQANRYAKNKICIANSSPMRPRQQSNVNRWASSLYTYF